MGLALMAREEERVEYTDFGTYSFQLMIARGIRTPTELARRIKTKDGYPLRISGQTVGNYFKGLHRVPPEFLQYETSVLNDVEPLTSEETERLGQLYAWRQRHPEAGGVNVENVRRGQDFIEEVEAEKNARRGARDGTDGTRL